MSDFERTMICLFIVVFPIAAIIYLRIGYDRICKTQDGEHGNPFMF